MFANKNTDHVRVERKHCFVQLRDAHEQAFEKKLVEDKANFIPRYTTFINWLIANPNQFTFSQTCAPQICETIPEGINPNKLKLSQPHTWRFRQQRRLVAEFDIPIEELRKIFASTVIFFIEKTHSNENRIKEAKKLCEKHLLVLYIEGYNDTNKQWERLGILNRDDSGSIPKTISNQQTLYSTFFSKKQLQNRAHLIKKTDEHCFVSLDVDEKKLHGTYWALYSDDCKETIKKFEESFFSAVSKYENMVHQILYYSQRFEFYKDSPSSQQTKKLPKEIAINKSFLQKYEYKRYIAEFNMTFSDFDALRNFTQTNWHGKKFNNRTAIAYVADKFNKHLVAVHVDVLDGQRKIWNRVHTYEKDFSCVNQCKMM